MVDIEVLGRPAVRHGGDRTLLRGRQPALLAALVLAAPRPVSSDVLLDAVWGDEQPRDPANALQQRISALRRLLGSEGAPPVLVTVPGGYTLQVADERIDARRFSRLADEGRALLSAGDPAAAAERLTSALALWRGPAFEGIADEPRIRADAEALQARRLDAVEDRLEARLALGEGAELLAELTALITEEPLRERCSGQLMRALYRAGRQIDALAEYERIRTRLAAEFGVDPSPTLARVHLQVLRQAEDLEVTTLAAPRPRRSTTNLPAAAKPVLGREEVIERIGERLAGCTLLTLVGPGGAGKSTVALEVARRHPRPPHGSWLVELASVHDADELPGAVLRAIGTTSSATADPGDDNDADTGQLLAGLRDRQLLLLLDNCEHLVEAVAALVGNLRRQAPGCTVLATSREPLGIDGETVWPLSPLTVPAAEETSRDVVLASPAVQLLLTRLHQHDPGLDPDHLGTEQLAAAATIARRLDGLPLALELAAARGRVLSVEELSAAMDDRFAVLTSTRRDVPARQRTLRDTITWSWSLLDPPLQRAWAALSVPVTAFDRPLADQLLDAAGVPGPALDTLEGLVERSLLEADRTATASRYRMLESLRAYAQERLQDSPQQQAVHDRHAEVVSDALERCNDRGDPRRFGVDLAGLASWSEEAVAALHWAADRHQLLLVQRVAAGLGWHWLLSGSASAGLRWLQRGLGVASGAPPAPLDPDAVHPEAVLWVSALLATTGSPHGPAWARHSLTVALEPDHRVLARLYAAVHRAHDGEVTGALDDLDAVVATAEGVGGWLLGFAHLARAQIGRLSGRMTGVLDHATAALEVLEDAGADWARVQAIDVLIDAIDPETDPERARRAAIEGLALCRRRGLPELEGRMLLQLGAATHATGDRRLAASYLAEAVQLTEDAGSGPSLAFALLTSGRHARRRGDHQLAVAQLTRARSLFAGTRLAYGATLVAIELARTHVEQGEGHVAARYAAEAARLADEVGADVGAEMALELEASLRLTASTGTSGSAQDRPDGRVP